MAGHRSCGGVSEHTLADDPEPSRRLRAAAALVPGSGRWASGDGEADTDLAHVHAYAAWCVRQCDACDDFERRLNRLGVKEGLPSPRWSFGHGSGIASQNIAEIHNELYIYGLDGFKPISCFICSAGGV